MKQRKELVGSNAAQVPERLRVADLKLTDDEVDISLPLHIIRD